MLIMLIGLLLAFVFDLVALVLSIVGLASRRARPALVSVALALSLAAIVLNVFDWLTIARGHGSRGEPLTWDDDWPLYAIPVGQVCIVFLALAATVTAVRRRRLV